ncbi:hypothetical protein QE152_g27818 [Popillia japonica]|uniref:Uncharacterized protein n=1 Tax=Popillia japonica TaxID=7064 RepID=A0AAW1JJD0_POPJA
MQARTIPNYDKEVSYCSFHSSATTREGVYVVVAFVILHAPTRLSNNRPQSSPLMAYVPSPVFSTIAGKTVFPKTLNFINTT